MNITHLSIGKRLGVGFGALVLIIVLIGSMAVVGVQTLSASLENFKVNRIPGMLILGELNRERMAIRAQTLSVLAYEAQAGVGERLRAIQAERQKSWQVTDPNWDQFVRIPRASEQGRALVEQLQGNYQSWRAIYVELDELIARLIAAADADQRRPLYAQYRETVNRMVPISDAMGKAFIALTEQNAKST
jgi:methyl-accepting chemotaxis protein